jgi:hypothetical protein
MSFAGLNLEGLDTAELIALLRLHFGISRHDSSGEMFFQRGVDKPCLSLKFDNNLNVSSVTKHQVTNKR